MNVCISCKNVAIRKLLSQKELTLIKQMHQKNVYFVIIGILKMLDFSLNYMFIINVMMF